MEEKKNNKLCRFFQKDIFLSAVMILFSFVILSCTNDKYCIESIDKITSKCSSDSSSDTCFVNMNEVYPFEWDEMFIIYADRSNREITKIIGTDCQCRFLGNNFRLVFFLQDGEIVKRYKTGCSNISYVDLYHDGVVYVKSEQANFFVIKKEENGVNYLRLFEVK